MSRTPKHRNCEPRFLPRDRFIYSIKTLFRNRNRPTPKRGHRRLEDVNAATTPKAAAAAATPPKRCRTREFPTDCSCQQRNQASESGPRNAAVADQGIKVGNTFQLEVLQFHFLLDPNPDSELPKGLKFYSGSGSKPGIITPLQVLRFSFLLNPDLNHQKAENESDFGSGSSAGIITPLISLARKKFPNSKTCLPLCPQPGVLAGGSEPATCNVRFRTTAARVAPLRLPVAVSDAAMFAGELGR